MNMSVNIGIRACCSLALLALGIGLLAGCQTSSPAAMKARQAAGPGPVAPVAVRVDDLMPARKLEVAKLRSGLVISFSLLVAGKEEFGEMIKRVSDAGNVVLPLLGTVTVKDLTLEQLGKELAVRYTKYYVDPQVIVDFVRDGGGEGLSPWGYITVLGRVKAPGRVSIPATRDLTVSGAIQKAGGFNSSSRSEAILVTRRDSSGELVSQEIDLNAVGAGVRVEDDIVLQAEDVVNVPEARF